MHHQLSCEQVVALLTFYVEDKLSDKLSQYVKEHLEICPECMEKYQKLKKLLNRFIEIQNTPIETPYLTKQYKIFKTNLSAYIDNELNDFDNIKIKKITISNPLARQDLENFYTFKKLIHASFEKTKNELKTDFSKSITNQIRQKNINENTTDMFLKLSATFFFMISCIVAGIIKFLYF